MAIPSTSNVTPLFVTRQPAWEESITLEQTVASDISTSRNGLEQRQQKSGRGRWRMDYKAYLNHEEEQERRIRAAYEIAAPLQVPFWTEAGLTASPFNIDTLSIDRAATTDFFAPGDWLYFDSAYQGQQFRRILSAGTTDQEIILYPLGGAVAFDALTPIYPCRLCVRASGTAEFEVASDATHLERLSYDTL